MDQAEVHTKQGWSRRFMNSWLFPVVITFVSLVVVPAPLVLAGEFVRLSHRVNDNAQVSFVQTCHALNRALSAARDAGHEGSASFQELLESTYTRSKSSTQATVNSPSATKEQKQVAVRNLLAIEILLNDAKAKVKKNDGKIDAKTKPLLCTRYPPIVPL